MVLKISNANNLSLLILKEVLSLSQTVSVPINLIALLRKYSILLLDSAEQKCQTSGQYEKFDKAKLKTAIRLEYSSR